MKRIFSLLTLCAIAITMFGQAKKPTLMVVPSEVWCTNNGYMEAFDNQGSIMLIPNYEIALKTNSDVNNVIGTIGGLMADRDFPLKQLNATMRSINNINTENNLLTSKTSGASIAESPLDKIRRTAKADIILELDWQINTKGPKKSVTYRLDGIDAYTNEQIAHAGGTGSESFASEVPVLLEEAVIVNMDDFTAQLQKYFDDLLENGRKVTVDILVFDNGSGIDLETEYEGDELAEIIDDWIHQNTVQNRYNRSDGTESFLLYENVRMPLYDAKGKAMDTYSFVTDLRKFLAKPPYGLECKVLNRGLGRAALIIGEK